MDCRPFLLGRDVTVLNLYLNVHSLVVSVYPLYNETMRVRVEVEYRYIPPEEEWTAIHRAAEQLTSDPSSVTLWLGRSDDARPAIIAEFDMPVQAQRRAVEAIRKAIYPNLGVEYSSMTIRFDRARLPRPGGPVM